jgi:hypothetical protein
VLVESGGRRGGSEGLCKLCQVWVIDCGIGCVTWDMHAVMVMYCTYVHRVAV